MSNPKPRKSGFVTIGDLAEGTPVVYEFGDMNMSTLQISFKTVKGYVGPRHTNRGGRERVVLLRTKAGARYGTVPLDTSVKLR